MSDSQAAPPLEETAKKQPRIIKVELVRFADSTSPDGLRTRTFQVRAEKKTYRDNGIMVLLTEMPAEQAEMWAFRALNVLATSGATVPGDPLSMGMAGIARMGYQALGNLPMNMVADLLREMFDCVAIVPDPRQPLMTRPPMLNDIREVPTRVLLRAEVFKLHTDFLEADELSPGSPGAVGDLNMSSTLTSQGPSAQPFRQVERR